MNTYYLHSISLTIMVILMKTTKPKETMNNNIIINKIDVKMRDMLNFENQLDVLQFALGQLQNKDLKIILSYANSKLKQDKLENK
jgi:hypothetical protein